MVKYDLPDAAYIKVDESRKLESYEYDVRTQTATTTPR